jgi:hypothetical protein
MCLRLKLSVQARLSEWKYMFKLRLAPGAHPDMVLIMRKLRSQFTLLQHVIDLYLG